MWENEYEDNRVCQSSPQFVMGFIGNLGFYRSFKNTNSPLIELSQIYMIFNFELTVFYWQAL